MLITQLKNPKTEQYYNVKNYILSNDFPWYYNYTGSYILPKEFDGIERDHMPWFSHGILIRPIESQKYSTVNNENIIQFQKMLDEIFDYNDLELKCLFRINANLVTPKKGVQVTPAHNDHHWPHKSMLIYLTDAGGKTYVGREEFDPKEDDIISFSGYPEKHYYRVPKEKNRVVIVLTYI